MVNLLNLINQQNLGRLLIMVNVNLADSIIAGTSAGGYSIGSKISFLKELVTAILIDSSQQSVSAQLLTSKGWMYSESCAKEGDLHCRKTYYYKDNIISLQFNSKEILYCICLSIGYEGTAFQRIGIGSKLSEIEKLFEVEYDSGDEMYYPKEKSGITGISFCIEEMFEEDEDIDAKKSEVVMICIHKCSLDCEM